MGEYADYALEQAIDNFCGWGRGGSRRKRLVDRQLAARRIMAHNAFDPIWESGEMTRSEAYAWLAEQLGIPKKRCHMEQMDVAMCDRVIDICTRRGFSDLFK
jgi:hypothetical protein